MRLRDERERTVDLLRGLVQRDSPSHHEGRSANRDTAVGFLAEAAADARVQVHSQVHSDESETLVQVLVGGRPKRRALAFMAHTDVVPAGEPSTWISSDPYSGELGSARYSGTSRVTLDVAGQRREVVLRDRMVSAFSSPDSHERTVVYGRGAFDDKGSIAALVAAMSALSGACADTGIKLDGDLIAAYTTDEEQDSTGIRRFGTDGDSWLAAHGYLDGPRDAGGHLTDLEAIVLEGSYRWAPVIGHRGGMHVALTISGHAAHAATPHLGVSAVEAMAHVIHRLVSDPPHLPDGVQMKTDGSLLGPLTMAPGTTIAGGSIHSVERRAEGTVVERSGLNVIPDWCEATIDIRFPPLVRAVDDGPLDPVEEILEMLRAWLEQRFPSVAWRATLSLVPGTFMPAVAIASSLQGAMRSPLVRDARHVASRILGRDPGLAVAPGGSDATFLIHEAGIPSLVEYGPGGGRSHDADEYVDLEDVVAGGEIIAMLAIERLGLAAGRGAGVAATVARGEPAV